MGMSDRVPGATPLDVRMDDIRAVMDAVGSRAAAVMGESEGGPLAMLFAAAHPERTVALILQGGEVRERTDDDWPWGEATEEQFEATIATLPGALGQGRGIGQSDSVERGRPGLAAIEAWWRTSQRNAATPAAAEAFTRMAFDIDVRHVVPAINVPTLIIHARGRPGLPRRERSLARADDPRSAIRRAARRRPPAWFDPDDTHRARSASSSPARARPDSPDRVLATVLFTDLVGSTERAAELGDRRWRDLLEQHHAAVRRELARFDGREVDTAGDGFFATFDGPARAIRCAQAIVECGAAAGARGSRRASTPGEVERAPTARSRASRSTSARASPRRRTPARSSSPAP